MNTLQPATEASAKEFCRCYGGVMLQSNRSHNRGAILGNIQNRGLLIPNDNCLEYLERSLRMSNPDPVSSPQLQRNTAAFLIPLPENEGSNPRDVPNNTGRTRCLHDAVEATTAQQRIASLG